MVITYPDGEPGERMLAPTEPPSPCGHERLVFGCGGCTRRACGYWQCRCGDWRELAVHRWCARCRKAAA